jgi:hypothetical protein
MTAASPPLVAIAQSAPRTRRLFGPGAFPVLTLSSFLPYLHKGTGLRYENLIGAGLAVLALGGLLLRGRLQRVFLPTLLLSTALFALVVASTILGSNAPGMLKTGIGRWDHYFRPVSILMIAAVAYHGATAEERERAFRYSIWVLLAGISINTLLQVGQVLTDVSAILDPFLPDASAGWTVASMAAGNSRLTGLFNQPLEHGLVSGVALLACVYCWRNGGVHPLLLLVAVMLVFVGGLLALSKVFLLGAVPVALLLAIAQGGIRPRHVVGALAALATMAGAATLLFSRWAGAQSVYALLRMLGDPEMVLLAVSGGRLGYEGAANQEFIVAHALAAFHSSPLFGVGTASGATLQDNEYLMTLAECGLAGLLLLLARLAAMLLPLLGPGWRHPAAPFFVAIALMAAGGGMGGPVSGIPRSGTILWVFFAQLAMLLTVHGGRRSEAR